MKALIIGAAGFVGGHLIEYLNSLRSVEVFATKLENEVIDCSFISNDHIYNLDIRNRDRVLETLQIIQPDYIFHLAAQSSVGLSWKEPALTYEINVLGSINVLDAMKKLNLGSRILLIGSSEVYGIVDNFNLPISEERIPQPKNPYAISKYTQEMTGKMFAESLGLDVVLVRAFNHIGPGQSPQFVISDFAKQIAEIEKGIREPLISVGNIQVKRDFTDVRDIVRGYWELMQKGKKGEVYNIGSGKSHTISSLLHEMILISGQAIDVKIDASKMRPADIEDIRADIEKINTHTSWRPEIAINSSLIDVVNYWRARC